MSLLIALGACGKKTSGEQPPPVVTDGGSGGGSTAVDYSYINPSNYCLETVKFYCARLKAGGCLAPAAEATCQAFMADFMADCFTADFAGLVQAGYVKWDAAAVNACFNAEKDKKTCGPMRDPNCGKITTHIPAASGGSCPSGFSGTRCDATSYCKPGTSACLGTCSPKGGPGAVCDWNTPCDNTTYCSLSPGPVAPGVCTSLVALNGACTGSEECGPDAYCPSSTTCQARKPVGQSCADSWLACAAPGACHPNTQICVLETQDRALGDTCDQGGWPQGCAPGLYCAGATGTTPGHCAQKLAAASPCVASDYSCADPLICKGSTCALPGDLGAACASDVDCLMGLWCTANQCALLPTLGQACSPFKDRCIGSRCDSASTSCVARLGNGSGCNVNSDCQSLVCNGSPSSSCLATCTY